jgi:hypothetical protein
MQLKIASITQQVFIEDDLPVSVNIPWSLPSAASAGIALMSTAGAAPVAAVCNRRRAEGRQRRKLNGPW